MGFSERLKLAMENAGYTQGKLAKEAGMAQSSIWRLVSGGAEGSRKAVKIANTLGIRPEWLTNGSGEMYEIGQQPSQALHSDTTEEIYRVDVLDIQASAGGECYPSSDFAESIKAIEYSIDQARSLFGNRPADTIKVITVHTDCMSGTIEPGDQIFLDTSVDHFEGDGVYVFSFAKTLHIKRLQMQKTAIAVLSDNKLYNPWTIEKVDEEDFRVIAKILMRQSIDYKRFS